MASTHAKSWWRNERGMSVPALFILSLPLLLLAFGYGFDSIRLMYLRSFLTSRAEQSASAGAATTYTASSGAASTVTIGKVGDSNVGESALRAAYDNYMENTAAKRRGGAVLQCTTMTYHPMYPSDPSSGAVIDWRLKVFMSQHQNSCGFYTQVVGVPISGAQLCSEQRADRPEYGVVVGTNEEIKMTFLKMFNIQSRFLNDIRGTALIRANDTC